jgi:hypothetical protein
MEGDVVNRMPCHISDGPQTPEDVVGDKFEDEDEAYERMRDDDDSWCEDHALSHGPSGCFFCKKEGKIAPMTEALTGWSSKYYEIPEGATELQDLVEHKNMNFAVGNIFKAAYRLGDKPGTEELYDLDKIIWFAQREKSRILKLK